MMFLDKRIIILLLIESMAIPLYVGSFECRYIQSLFVVLMFTYIMLEVIWIAMKKILELTRKVYTRRKPNTNL